ncbi:hypothetical protein T492DRAFT_833317 [Pavlovales sp. CCMP2436]|nr:hypothetical protein T492DRAFT_833317 [Pavlovales sp. CCMP2436]
MSNQPGATLAAQTSSKTPRAGLPRTLPRKAMTKSVYTRIKKAPFTGKTQKLNKFQVFAAKKRHAIKEEQPELEGKLVSQKISELWKALSNEQKEEYKLKR